MRTSARSEDAEVAEAANRMSAGDLKALKPEHFDVLEFAPGEEC